MKKLVLYFLLLGAALLLPTEGTDVGKLLPVEVVQLNMEGDRVVIATDVGATGSGLTIYEAVENMNDTTGSVVFLDTADFLLIAATARTEAVALKEYLKGNVRVCGVDAGIELKNAAKFLAVHKPKLRLRDYQGVWPTETLAAEGIKMMLKEN